MTTPAREQQEGGITCSGCHKDVRSGYFLCDDCYATRTSATAPEPEEQWRIEKYSDSVDLYLNGVFISKCKDMVSVQCVQDAVKRAQNKAAKAAREQVLDALTPQHVNRFKGLVDGWKIDSKFLKEIKGVLDNPDEWSIDMEEIEVVLIAVQKVLRAQQQEQP